MSKLRSLSLILAGFVMGVGLSYSSDIQAAASKLLGSKVSNTMNVKLNKKKIGQAAVINGVSYLPVRVVANELNLGVGVSGQDVNLTSVDTSDELAKKAAEEQEAMNKKAETINKLTSNIREIKNKIEKLQGVIFASGPDQVLKLKQKIEWEEKYVGERPELIEELKSDKDRLQKIYDDAAAAQKQIDELTPQLAALEAQLAELQK